ncbi:MAG: HU family DNA-binding protein [Patescibacteria group bacterium]
MKKPDFVMAVAEATGMQKKEAQAAVEAVLDVIVKTMSRGEDVVFTGFGTFKVYKRAERMGRNPATGEAIKIKAMVKPKFRPGKLMKEAVM